MSCFPHVLMTLLIATWASLGVSYGKAPCCAPTKVTLATTYDDGQLMYNLYLDFDKGLALEDWDGNQGIDRILYDMNGKIVYKGLETSCYSEKYTLDKYIKCIPSNAQYYDAPALDGKEMDGFKYKIGDTDFDLVVTADTCLARRMTVTDKDGSEVKVNFNGDASIADPTVFDDLVRAECPLVET